MTTATKVTKVAAMGKRDQNLTILAQLAKIVGRRKSRSNQDVISKNTDWWVNRVHGV